jgi:hypothetical protein
MQHPIIIDPHGRTLVRDDLKSRIIKKYISSAAGRSTLAAAMIQPIRRSLDYQGIARRALVIDQLPTGALSSYDKDIDVAGLIAPTDEPIDFKHDAIVINSRGKTGKKFRGVRIPQFEIFSNPTIKIGDIKRRRFDLIDRSSPTKTEFKNDPIVINSRGKTEKKTKRGQRRRFNVIDRAVQKARQEIMAAEDAAIFKMLDEIAAGNSTNK